MKQTNRIQTGGELDQLCASVRAFVAGGRIDACRESICRAMEQYPHAPQPHNLMGIVLEKTGDHPAAMKHFRAAWALDPSYLPAKHNLNTYGTFFSGGGCAFDESDIPSEPTCNLKVVYDDHGIGRIIRR